MRNSYSCYNYYYSARNYGKPKRITDQGYIILHNSGCTGGLHYITIPNHINKLISRLRQTILDLKVKLSKAISNIVITIFKTEPKLSRKAYMNQLINQLL